LSLVATGPNLPGQGPGKGLWAMLLMEERDRKYYKPMEKYQI